MDDNTFGTEVQQEARSFWKAGYDWLYAKKKYVFAAAAIAGAGALTSLYPNSPIAQAIAQFIKAVGALAGAV